MGHFDEAEDPRRRILIKALAAGLFSTALPERAALASSFFGSVPGKLPAGQSIYRINGTATVNGKAATLQTRINPGDTVETGKDSEIIFVVNGNNSMILRANSHLVIETPHKPQVQAPSQPNPQAAHEAEQNGFGSLLVSGLRLLSGKLLSVSRNTPMQVNTVNATIGIRGTGFYVESDPGQTYFCTCYGTTDVAAAHDPASRETVTSTHSHHPLYIVNDGGQGRNIRNAPFINHTDQELELIEALVGRTPPFVFAKDDYTAPRRDY